VPVSAGTLLLSLARIPKKYNQIQTLHRRTADTLSPLVQTVKPLRLWLAVLLLVAGSVLVYAQVSHFEFVYFDDNEYVTQNSQVQAGLTIDGVKWAFTALVSKHWHPVTWLSHMLDVELFGLDPAGHHLVNLGLHLLTVLLFFGFLAKTTGQQTPALVAALLLTVHPLHVENVAWVADRKDLLCAFFWMLTLHAYASYTQRPGIWRYATVLLAFGLAVLSKSMALTLPIVLLLLDIWPLRRLAHQGPDSTSTQAPAGHSILFRLFIEKVPLLVVSIAIGLTSFYAIMAARIFTPLLLHTEAHAHQGASAYLVYLVKLVYPARLATPYPATMQVTYWLSIVSTVVILLMSYLVIRWYRRHPYLLVGWFWYLVVLFPVAGFVGPLRIADRYGYLSLIGIYILISWGATALCARWPRLRTPYYLGVSVWIIILTLLAYQQTGHWQNTMTLFRNTLAVNPDSSIARSNIGIYLQDQGRLDEAIRYQQEAVGLAPHKPEFHYNLGVALIHKQRYAEALVHFTRASSLRPGYVAALSNRGLCLLHIGQLEEARREFERVLALEPDHYHTNNNLGRYYLMTGNYPKAENLFRRVASIHPERSNGLANLANALAAQGKSKEAAAFYRQAIGQSPDKAGYYFSLAGMYTLTNQYAEAADLRLKGLARDPHNAAQHYFLSVDYYFSGNFAAARKYLEKAKQMAYSGVEQVYEQRLRQAISRTPPQAPDGN